MNCIRRLAAAAAVTLAGALLVSAAAAPDARAWADPPLPPGRPPRHWTGPLPTVRAHTAVVGGTPGWQIALIAAAALAAAAALLWTGPKRRRAPRGDHLVPGCPLPRGRDGAHRRGLPAEAPCRFTIRSTGGPRGSAGRTRRSARHPQDRPAMPPARSPLAPSPAPVIRQEHQVPALQRL